MELSNYLYPHVHIGTLHSRPISTLALFCLTHTHTCKRAKIAYHGRADIAVSASVCCSSNADTSTPQFTLDFSLSCWIAFKSLSVTSKWLINLIDLLFYLFSIRFPSSKNCPSSLSHSAILAIVLSQVFDCITKYGCISPPSPEINTFFCDISSLSLCVSIQFFFVCKNWKCTRATDFEQEPTLAFTALTSQSHCSLNSALTHCWTPFSLD